LELFFLMKTASLYNFPAQILRKTLEHMGILDSNFFSPKQKQDIDISQITKKN